VALPEATLQSLDPQVRTYITAIETTLEDVRTRNAQTEHERDTYQKKYGALEIRYDVSNGDKVPEFSGIKVPLS